MDESGKLRVEILTFEGCQNAAITRDRLKLALEMEHLDARIEEIDVCSAELAEQMRFLGSPSVRVNDEDVEGTPEAPKYGLMCRTYLIDGRLEGAPSATMIRAALRRVIAAQERKFELHRGFVMAFAGGTSDHDAIAFNLRSELNQLFSEPCRTFGSNM